jgi:hypothetical protein
MRHIAALVAVLITSCSSVQFASDDEALIAESVLRSLYGNNASAGQSNKVGASLCINGKDPSPEFLKRFNNLHPEPLACSASEYNENLGELVKRGTTKPMISFSVADIKITSRDNAIATGGYYEASLSSAGYSFKLTRVDGKWIVQEQRMNWIS